MADTTRPSRRNFIAQAGLAAGGAVAAVGVASPAIAQTAPELRWRLTSAFPKTLDTLHGAGDIFARALAELTDNRFQVQTLHGDDLAPGAATLDAVAAGTFEMAHCTASDHWARDAAFAFGTATPFGLNYRMQNAWMYQGGGIDMMNAVFNKYGVAGLPMGNTGAQMGGWYRREIKTVGDLRGMRIRIGGFGAAVLQKLGAAPQALGVNEIYAALEKGTIDGAEWVGPYDDERLGLQKVAKYFYYPACWAGQGMQHLFINKAKWDALPRAYQGAVTAAALTAHATMTARYDISNAPALRRLLAGSTELRPFGEDILDAAYKASNEVYAEIGAVNPAFKKLYDAMKQVRADNYLWFQVAENSFDTYMMIQQRKQAL
jgi:TRAP-type mannitol/chloroaromatic compound transport system substrate-binding protein